MSELKPCPFCGGKALISAFDAFDDIDYMSLDMPDYEVTCENERCICGWYLPPEIWNTRPIEDALHTRIAELEARLGLCESALVSMTYQFFYSSESGALVHSFMSAEEEAAEYLVDYGIARWENEHKHAIVFLGG